MSGPEMLLKAAISAFVPKETAAQITAVIEGMLRDGSLDGIATLVSDVREISESQKRIEFGQARIYAVLQRQCISDGRTELQGSANEVSGGSRPGPGYIVVAEQRPVAAADHGIAVDAGGEFNGMGVGSDRETNVHFTAHGLLDASSVSPARDNRVSGKEAAE